MKNSISAIMSLLATFAFSVSLYAQAPVDTVAVFEQTTGEATFPGEIDIDKLKWHGDRTALVDSVIYGYAEKPDWTSSKNSAVWGLPVNFDVTPDGAATFTVPIDVPKGAGGAAPQLYISYNSLSGNGVLGLGCGISGVSSITRCSRDLYHDGTVSGVDYSTEDALSLDGVRMILKSGKSLEDGAVYVLENDPFTELTVHGSGDGVYFTASLPYGGTATYGSLQTFTGTDGKSHTASWHMSRTADSNGNYIDYSYMRDEQYMYLSEVRYGGNLRSNSLASLQNRVLFRYGSRPDIQSDMLGSSPFRMRLRLKRIEALCGDSLYRSYTPAYTPATASGYSLLENVLVENSSGLTSYVMENTWNRRGDKPAVKELDVTPRTVGLSEVRERIYVSADMNGDGISDILEFLPSKVDLGGGSFTDKTYCVPNLSESDGNGGVRFTRHREFDIDYETLARRGSFLAVSSGGDGCTDLVIPELAGSLSGKSNILRFHVFRGGKDGICDKWHDVVPEMKLFAWTSELPLCAAADIDNDGIHEIIAVETSAQYGSYGCTVVKYPNGGTAAGTPVLKCLNLESAPRSLFTGDFNNDGLTDIVLVFDKNYMTLLNDGTDNIVSWRKVYGGSAVRKHDDIESGDFNGDGVPDIVMHSGKSITLALCNGDGTFTACPSQSFGSLSVMNSENSQLNVYDFDGDGKSDVVVTKNNGLLETCWFKSSGTALSLFRNSSLGKDSGEARVYASVGDYDGDGRAELLNYGYDCTLPAESGKNDHALRTYPWSDASTDKISFVADALGNTVSVEYRSMASGVIYEKGSGSVFPVMDVTAPICAVASVTRSNGAAGFNTTEYRYGGLKLHCQGKGPLGMSVFSAKNERLGTSQETAVTQWDGTYFTPSVTLSVQKAGDAESRTITEYSIAGKQGKSFFRYPVKVTSTDFDGNVTTTENGYDTSKGVPLHTRTTDSDGAWTATSYETYERHGGRWLPVYVTETRKHPDDNAVYSDCTEYGYDDCGNTVSRTVHIGTPKELAEKMEHDVYGNVTASWREGADIPTVRHVNEYDDNGRDIIRTYTEPASAVTEYEYDSYGNVVRESDQTYGERGVSTTRIYDTAGRNAVTVSPEGVHSGTIVGWSGGDVPGSKYFRVTYGTGVPWTKTWHDACGRELKSETVGFGNVHTVKETAYDSRGQVTGVKTRTDDLTATVSRTYDSRGRLLTESASDGSVKRYTYGNRHVDTDDNGRQYSREYDSWGNLRKSSDPESSVEYRYYSSGKPRSATSGGSTVSMEYDAAGNRTVLDDPDAGRIKSSYDAEGRTLSKTDGRGVKTEYKYDRLGRLSSRRGAQGDVYYTYNRYGAVTETEHQGNIERTLYDKFGRRIMLDREYAGGKTLEYTYRYNNAGQLEREVYPGKVTVSYTYDSYGNRTAMKVGDTAAWRLLKSTGKLAVEELLSGKLTLTEKRTDNGYLSSSVLERNTDNPKVAELFSAEYEFDEARGNMLSRAFKDTGKKENFRYDALDRLVNCTVSLVAVPAGPGGWGGTVQYDTSGPVIGPVVGPGTVGGLSGDDKYSYAPNGNIIHTTGLGDYEYDEARPHAVAGVEAPGQAIPATPQSVEYNDIGKVDRITETGSDGKALDLYYDYGPDDERWATELMSGGKDLYLRYYAPSCDIVTEDGVERQFLYLGNGVLHYSENSGEGKLLYMFTDHQGSVMRIYDADGNEQFSAEYSPWGYATVKKNLIGFTRGYTGHETLSEFRLIDMNGRLYDPVLGRFLSPDNYVQMPESSQSFNRYSYCLNNPLKYTDPSGQLFGIDDILMIGAIGAISGYTNAIASGGNVWKGALTGGLTSLASYGIGSFFGHTVGSFGGELLRAGTHGLSNGLTSMMDGHSFGTGFASGFASSLAGSGIGVLGVSSKFMMNASCTVAGGLASWATGDNFFYGAGIGGNIGAYNHGWRYVKSEDCYYYDEELKEVIVTGKRSLTGRIVNYASGVCVASQTIGRDVVIGNNGKYYFRHDNGKIFRGNQYVKTRAVKTMPHAKLLGRALGAISEVPSVVYAANTYGVDSREYYRAITVALGEFSGGEVGSNLGGDFCGYVAGATIGSMSSGIMAGPAFVGGEIVGNICGAWLGAKVGGFAAGFVFDLYY